MSKLQRITPYYDIDYTGGNVTAKVDKLKPCKCGSEVFASDEIYHCLYRPSRNGWHVACFACDTLFGFDVDYAGIFETEQEAIRSWNRRVSDEMDIST